MVEGDVPDRGRLLLHAELPARHRRAGRRGGVAAGDAADRGADPVRDAADVPAGGGGEPERAGLGGHARAAAAVLVGQAVRADPARLRRHLVDHHDHPVGGRRHRALRAEPVRARRPRRTTGCCSPSGCCWCSAGCSWPGSARPSASRCRWWRCSWLLNAVVVVGRRWCTRSGSRSCVDRWLDALLAVGGPGNVALAAFLALPAAGARPVRLRDRREHDAAGARRRRRRAGTPAQPDRQHPHAAHRRRADHERLPDHHQLRHHRAGAARGVRRRAAQANGRALAYLAHELLGDGVRHRLRHQLDPHPVVRRRVGDGRIDQHRAAVPARLRHGPGVGARGPPGRAGLHRRLRSSSPLLFRRRRRRPGRRLRHRHPGHDGVGGVRGDDVRAPARAAARASSGSRSSP